MAEQASAAVHEAVMEAEELAKQIEEGVLLPDGTPVLVKRKRPTTSIGRAIAAEEKAQMLKAQETAAAAAAAAEGSGTKRKSPGPGEEAGEGSGAPKAKAAKEKKEKPPKEPKPEKPEKPEKGKKGKKGGGAAAALYEAGMVVEVTLRLGESFATWYEAQLVEQGKGTKWKVQLVRRSEGDPNEYEPLRLQGRNEFENGPMTNLRPLPPSEYEWQPSIGNECELIYEDGWWKVRVQAEAEGGEWTVVYTPAQAVHTVPRDRLRPIHTWDINGQKYEPLKVIRR